MPSWYISGFERPRGPTAIGTAAASFTGPGDVVSGAAAWWGLRAYSGATVGSNLVKLRRDSDDGTQDFASLASGALDVSSISSFKGAANLFVHTLYDQSGNGRNATQTTNANQPAFTLSGLGSLPIITFTGASGHKLTTASFSVSQPFSVSAVAIRPSAAARDSYLGDGGGGIQISFSPNANELRNFAGNNINSASPIAYTDNTWSAIQSILNSTTSGWYVDGNSKVDLDAGTTGITAGVTIGDDAFSDPFDGSLTELGIWGSAFNATQASNMNSNQHTYWVI